MVTCPRRHYFFLYIFESLIAYYKCIASGPQFLQLVIKYQGIPSLPVIIAKIKYDLQALVNKRSTGAVAGTQWLSSAAGIESKNLRVPGPEVLAVSWEQCSPGKFFSCSSLDSRNTVSSGASTRRKVLSSMLSSGHWQQEQSILGISNQCTLIPSDHGELLSDGPIR